jgi:hypothetical protein
VATFYWTIQLDSITPPSALEVGLGQDGNGTPLPVAQKGSVVDTGQASPLDGVPSTGLTPGVAYRVSWIWDDGLGDLRGPVSAPFNTNAANAVGGMATGEFLDDAAFSGARTYFGAMAVTEAEDTFAAAGTVIAGFNEGDFDAFEDEDTFAATGAVGAPTGRVGDLAALEQRDVAAFTGARTFFGTMTATETRDNAAFSGIEIPSFSEGTLDVEEARDLAAITGTATTGVPITGALAVTEVRDVAAFAGIKSYFGALATTEARDNAAFVGFITKFVTGTMAALESRDVANFDSNPTAVSSRVILRDANVGMNVTPTNQWRDGAPSNPDGTLLPTRLGHANVVNNFANRGDNVRRQVQLVQASQDTQALVDVVPGYYAFIDVKAGEWVWCISRDIIAQDADNPIGQDDVVV